MWRTKGEALNASHSVKHGGGNVMVWGCMAASGLGTLHFIDGTMNSEMYEEILRCCHQPGSSWAVVTPFSMITTSNTLQRRLVIFFKQKRIKVLNWPPQSPDLNPIEHLWEVIEHRPPGSSAKKPTGTEEPAAASLGKYWSSGLHEPGWQHAQETTGCHWGC